MNAVSKSGTNTFHGSLLRLFMVPGMGHCQGTNGAENYDVDTFKILTAWKQSGNAPDQLAATPDQGGTEVGKRLVCAYPRVAVYKGSGRAEDPGNFTCKVPRAEHAFVKQEK
jgi:feruloyl esterase